MADITNRTKEFLLFPECDKPEDPPPVTEYSCIYEYACVLDCSAGQMEQNDGFINDIKGIITTRTDNGDLNINTSAATAALGSPYTYPIFLGKVSDEEWDKIKVQKDGTKFNNEHLLANGPGWVLANNDNRLAKPWRWHLAKFYYETVRYQFDFDPETLVPNDPFVCPLVVDYVPPKPTKEDWVRWGIKCPPYYELKPCVDCAGKVQNRNTLYWEMIDGVTLPKPIVQFAMNNDFDNDGEFDCYSATQLLAGPRDANNFSTLRFGEQSFANHGVTFQGYGNCDVCKRHDLVAISKVSNTTGTICDASSINVIPAPAAVNQCIADGKIVFRYVERNAANAAFFGVNGTDFFYKAADGECRRLVKLNEALLLPGLCVPQAFYDAASAAPSPAGGKVGILDPTAIVDIYANYCLCENDGGSIGTNQGQAYRTCHPLSVLLTFTNNVDDETQDEREDVTFSATVISTKAPIVKWYQIIPARAGVPAQSSEISNGDLGGKVVITQSGPTATFNTLTLTIKDVPLSFSGRKYYCLVDNTQGVVKASRIGTLSVVDVPDKIIKDSTVVRAVKLKVWCPVIAGGGNLGKGKLLVSAWRWTTDPVLNSSIGKFFAVDNMRVTFAPGDTGAGCATAQCCPTNPLGGQYLAQMEKVLGPMTWGQLKNGAGGMPGLAGNDAQGNETALYRLSVSAVTFYNTPTGLLTGTN